MNTLKVSSAVLLLGLVCTAQDTARSPGWVVIPINEYSALRSKAYPVQRAAGAPTVEAALSRVDYDLHLDGAVASGRASMTVDVLKDGWVRVPIPPGLLVREASLGARPISLVPVGTTGQLSAVLSAKGRSILLLDVVFSVGSAAGEERLSLPTGASGVTRASVSGAGQDVEVKVSGGLLAENTPAHWLAYARGGDPLTFVWRKRKIDERSVELPLRWRGSLSQLVGLGEDSTSLSAEVGIEVVQGAAQQVKIAVPDTVAINSVPGATVADWDVKDGLLVVNFLDPVERSAKFAIVGEARLPRDGAIDVPILRLPGAEREAGGIAVEVLGAGEIKDTRLQGLEPADAAELGPVVAGRQSPSLAAFRFRTGPADSAANRSLGVQVTRYAQQAVLTANIEEARYRVMVRDDGKALVEARFAVRNNQRNFVRVTLPAASTVWGASLAGQPVLPGKAPDGSLLFPLRKDRAGEEAPLFAIEILYLARGPEWGMKGRASLPLPTLDLPVSRTGLVLYHPPLFRVTPEPGAFRVQPYEPPASPALTASAAPLPAEQPASAQTNASQSATQALVDRYRVGMGAHRVAAVLPARVSFPTVGPSIFLVAELTGEGNTPLAGVEYQKASERGVK